MTLTGSVNAAKEMCALFRILVNRVSFSCNDIDQKIQSKQ